MTITYRPHELKLKMKYKCNCGHKMTRINSDYYTLSPFNNHSIKANDAKLYYSIYTKKRKCPKCGDWIYPFLNEDNKKQVIEWKRIYDEGEL
jgi:hypothetical protein